MRWALTAFQLAADGFQYAAEIFDHLVIPEPDHTVAVTAEFSRARRVRLHLIGVLPAIELDGQLVDRAREIHHMTADRMLPTQAPLRRQAQAQLLHGAP